MPVTKINTRRVFRWTLQTAPLLRNRCSVPKTVCKSFMQAERAVEVLTGETFCQSSTLNNFEAGVHFGHHTRRWNPKMAEYIFTERNGIYIIDLQKTVKKFDEAYMFVRDLAASGGSLLFIGTKKQAADSIREEATRCGMYYVNMRWPGGMLTNYKTIKKSIQRLNNLNKMAEDGTFDLLPKKEVAALMKEMQDLERNYGGIKDMPGLPDAVYVVDPRRERSPLPAKARYAIIAIVDTNCDRTKSIISRATTTLSAQSS